MKKKLLLRPKRGVSRIPHEVTVEKLTYFLLVILNLITWPHIFRLDVDKCVVEAFTNQSHVPIQCEGVVVFALVRVATQFQCLVYVVRSTLRIILDFKT
jgi:hypothetical protein